VNVDSSVVSTVLIFFNAEKFIAEAIESVFAQTYPHWELLLVDDGSTDSSTRIAREYARRFASRVRYIEHPQHRNLGMSASRNVGIKNARGQYIALLDADDVWLPHKLAAQVALLRAHRNAQMVYSSVVKWNSWNGSENPDSVQDLGVPTDTIAEPPLLLPVFLRNHGHEPRTCGVLIRNNAVRQIGGFENSFRGMFEDQAFFMKLCLRFPVYVMAEGTAKYRQHQQSCCADAVGTGKLDAARLEFLTWLSAYMSDERVSNSDVWRALHRELRPLKYPKLSLLRAKMRAVGGRVRQAARAALPRKLRRWIRAYIRQQIPRVGAVRFGDLRRLEPISRDFGFARGLPVDRYYIEQFLTKNAADIRGHVLEIGDDRYIRLFGGDRVSRTDILHVRAGNPKATIIADLTNADQLPSDRFDCIVIVQTLQLIYDLRAAVQTLHRIVKPGGVVLATAPAISQRTADEWADMWCWSFSRHSARRLFAEFFATENVQCTTYGNVLTATALLHGIASNELRCDELGHRDPQYDLLIAIRAVKLVQIGK
jgi:glycosyltransferase involved in cell wall biosynthesis